MNARAAESVGMAYLGRRVFDGDDIGGLAETLLSRAMAASPDAGALHDLGLLLQMTGHREQALAFQRMALESTRLFRTVHGSGGLRVLALMVPGDLMANTPVDFLLERSDVELLVHYGEPGEMAPDPPPIHDVAIVAVSESDENAAALASLSGFAANWPAPVVNGCADRIAALSRDRVSKMFEGDPHLFAPRVVRAARALLEELASGLRPLPPVVGSDFPIIVRPTGSHAGRGLEKLTTTAELLRYLAERDEPEFYVSPFIDYSGADGLFRKLRIAMIDGRPFISHLAVSEHWMVHYLNAGMSESEAKRAEEAAFMASFDDDFAVRHESGFASLQRAIGLDYFGIDCAELPDGRLLLFEADVAMIVHSLDPPDLYPYKIPAMDKLFAAFMEYLARMGRLPEETAA